MVASELVVYDVDRLEFGLLCVAATFLILTLIKNWGHR